MTKTLQQAFAEASKLDPEEQEALAKWILDELADDRRWSESFSASQTNLANLANEALAEHRKGETKDLDPDRI